MSAWEALSLQLGLISVQLIAPCSWSAAPQKAALTKLSLHMIATVQITIGLITKAVAGVDGAGWGGGRAAVGRGLGLVLISGPRLEQSKVKRLVSRLPGTLEVFLNGSIGEKPNGTSMSDKANLYLIVLNDTSRQVA